MNPGEIITTVVGNLTGVPELRFTENGKAVANFTIAENHRRFVDGNWVDDGASFVRVTVWGNLAENVCESFPEQGMPVMAYGTLRIKRWKGDDDVSRDQAELTAIAVGPNLQFSIADVKRPQNKWGTKESSDVTDEMFGTSKTDDVDTDSPESSTENDKTEEPKRVSSSRSRRKQPAKTTE